MKKWPLPMALKPDSGLVEEARFNESGICCKATTLPRHLNKRPCGEGACRVMGAKAAAGEGRCGSGQ